MQLNVVGFDPSMNNWGMARGIFDTETNSLQIEEVGVIQPEKQNSKQVRKNSQDLRHAQQLYKGAEPWALSADAYFVEVPVGSKSARAMASYGICIGILSALKTRNRKLFEVTPLEVKLAAVGDKNASKQAMIDWAVANYLTVQWPRHNGKIVASKIEHMADAIAAIVAGTQLDTFNQAISFFGEN